ncbi:MAG TPA: phosphatase PAP2 family protein [Gemmatimonadaceae bacterium]
MDDVMWTLSAVGRGGALFIGIALVFALTRRISPGGIVRLLAAVLLATTVADYVVKPLVHRQRPFEQQPNIRVIGGRPEDPSFPSGHAANAFAAALVLARLLPQGRMVWWVLALGIAASRVYLGVHYPTDVLGGALIGLGCGALLSARWTRPD